MSRRLGWLSLTALLLTSLVLRPPLAAVGPLLPEIAKDLHVGLALQGLLTSIPVLSFGFGAFAGPWLSRRLGIDRLMLILQALLLASILLRPWFGFAVLVTTTAITGLHARGGERQVQEPCRPGHLGIHSCSRSICQLCRSYRCTNIPCTSRLAKCNRYLGGTGSSGAAVLGLASASAEPWFVGCIAGPSCSLTGG